MAKPLMQNSNSTECPVVKMANALKANYHVHYDGQYMGIVEARTTTEAFRKAKAKYGSHIIKNDDRLEVARGE